MKPGTHLMGFWDRIDIAANKSGLSKNEIARRIGCNRKTLYRNAQNNIGSFYLAKFCAVTNTDANWLLGLKER